MKKKIKCSFLFFILINIILFSGCSDVFSDLYSLTITNIDYNGETYQLTKRWEIIDNEDFVEVNIKKDNQDLKCKVYDCDKQNNFIDCNGDVFHKVSADYPNDDINSITSIKLFFLNPKKDINISDYEFINEFSKIISKDMFYTSLENKKLLCTIGVVYRNCPAMNYCGEIYIDNNDKLWLSYSPNKDDSLIKYYYSVSDGSCFYRIIDGQPL